MKTHLALALLTMSAVGAFAIAQGRLQSQLNAQKIFQQPREAVVYIEAASFGTGVFHPTGCMLTAAHVIGDENQQDITVRLHDGRAPMTSRWLTNHFRLAYHKFDQ